MSLVLMAPLAVLDFVAGGRTVMVPWVYFSLVWALLSLARGVRRRVTAVRSD